MISNRPPLAFAAQSNRGPAAPGFVRFGLLVVLALGAQTVRSLSPDAVFDKAADSVVAVVARQAAKGHAAVYASGVVVAPHRVVTTCHGLVDAESIEVVHRRASSPATVEYRDGERNLCQLRADRLVTAPLDLRRAPALRAGERVFALSSLAGQRVTISEGLVSALPDGADVQLLQTSAPFDYASSGGPLVDEDARLVALALYAGTEGQNVNYAAPASWIPDLPQRVQAGAAGAERSDWQTESLALSARSDWEGLHQHTLRWLSVHPESAVAWVQKGIALLGLDRLRDAAPALAEATRLNPRLAHAWALLGIAHARAEAWDQAEDAGQRAVQEAPNRAAGWVALGEIHQRRAQYDKALEALTRATDIEPRSPYAWAQLGEFRILQGRFQEAVFALRQAAQLQAGSSERWLRLGNALLLADRPERAAAAFERVLGTEPKNAAAWGLLALAFEKLERPRAAIAAFDKAIDADVRVAAPSWVGIGRVHAATHRYEQAADAYRSALRHEPKRADAWAGLYEALGSLNRYDELLRTAGEAARADTTSALHPYWIGLAHLRAGRPERAVAGLRRAVELQPTFRSAWYELGRAYGRIDDRPAVREAYVQLVKLNPATAAEFHRSLMFPYGEAP